MPGGRGNGAKEIIEAVKNGEISETELNEAVDRIIDIARKVSNQFAYDEKLGAYLEMNKAGKETSLNMIRRFIMRLLRKLLKRQLYY